VDCIIDYDVEAYV